MGRLKGGNKKSEKEEHDDRHGGVIEAIRAKRQECLEALERPNLLNAVKFPLEISRISCPSRPSLPLAQASKLAAHCAITLHLRQKDVKAPEEKLQQTVMWLIGKAVQWAWEGILHLHATLALLPTCADLPQQMHAAALGSCTLM